MYRRPTFNRTKIIATAGPACEDKEVMRQLILAGVDVVRLNMSHGSHEQHAHFIKIVREINQEEGTFVSILLDLQGPKLRIGKLKNPIPLEPGMELTFSCAIDKEEDGKIPVEYPSLAEDLKPGDIMLIDDGKIKMEVVESDGVSEVRMRVIHGKELKSRKGINLPHVAVSLPSITEKDLLDLEFGLRYGVEWVALSFVRTAEEIEQLRKLLVQAQSQAKIIAKIEKPQALKNINAIIEATDAVMIARGDLGVEIPIEEVPFWQKRIIQKCNAAAKPAIVATQMLDSMIERPSPTRAEVADIANAVLDGADAVMLSGETSVGKYPVEAVEVMQRVIAKAEHDPSLYERHQQPSIRSKTFLSDVVCLAAVKIAQGIRARAIIGMTRSGYTAFQLSRHRPKAPIYIFTDNRPLISSLNLVWGVRAFYYDKFVGTNETIEDVINILKQHKLLRKGDVVVNTASMPLKERGRTNMVKVTRVP